MRQVYNFIRLEVKWMGEVLITKRHWPSTKSMQGWTSQSNKPLICVRKYKRQKCTLNPAHAVCG